MRVLLATDFSTFAETARALVAALPLPEGSTIRVVHTVEPMPMVSAFSPVALTTLADEAERQAREQLHAVAEGLGRPGRTVEVALGFGRAADVVVEEAAACAPDLIVMGSRGRRGLASALLGSVSAEVIDRAPCPVLIARKPTLRSIVLADDGSASAARGAGLVALPFLRGVPVRVVSVVDAPIPMLVGDAGGTASVAAMQAYEETLPILRDTHKKIAGERVAALAAAGIAATAEVREGDAAAEIVAAAVEHDADLVVVGSRGETGLRRFVLGSVARSVLFATHCSVLIAHEPVRAKVVTDGEIAVAAR